MNLSFSRIRAIFFRYLYAQVKGPQALNDLLYWPLIEILLWGLTSVWIQSQSVVSNLPLILMTGLIFWQMTWRGSLDLSICLLQEYANRNLINLFSTPLKLSEWCFGVILVSLCKLMVTISFGTIIVYILYSLNVFTIGWAFLPFAALLFLFGLTIGFMTCSILIYWKQQAEALAWMIVFSFAPFSAVFYPASFLPIWAQKISWCLPTTYIFEGMREILHEKEFPMHYFWISLILNIVYLIVSILLFNFMFEKSRKKGLARLE